MTVWNTITVERRDRVGLITLNRPEALNALNLEMLTELVAAASELDADTGIGAIVLTGSVKAFAAGADIKEMVDMDYQAMYASDWFEGWSRFTAVRTPIIAAVSGFALGGGCEVVMMCDIVIAGENAKFGQPEIKLGVIPCMGGSQRLTRAVGKAKAMEMILTGRTMGADEAERAGLVSRVVPTDSVLDEALAVGVTIGSMSLPIAMMAKEAVNATYETMLENGIRFERRIFHATFATQDQKEGMSAFVEKRDPQFKNR
ncbi:MAG: enoyl-CoA hydratase [Terrimesophilobacter sp.]